MTQNPAIPETNVLVVEDELVLRMRAVDIVVGAHRDADLEAGLQFVQMRALVVEDEERDVGPGGKFCWL